MALESAAAYHYFGEKYGWTPSQVDELPAWLRDRLPTVAAVSDEVAEEQARRNAKS